MYDNDNTIYILHLINRNTWNHDLDLFVSSFLNNRISQFNFKLFCIYLHICAWLENKNVLLLYTCLLIQIYENKKLNRTLQNNLL